MTNFGCLSAVYELIIFEDYFVEVYCYDLLKETGMVCFIVLMFCFVHCFVFACSSLLCLYVLCVMLVCLGFKAVAGIVVQLLGLHVK